MAAKIPDGSLVRKLRSYIIKHMYTFVLFTLVLRNQIIIIGPKKNRRETPGGLTLIPWREGCSATWDVTVTNTAVQLKNIVSTATSILQESQKTYMWLLASH
jgi:hypothetical protein